MYLHYKCSSIWSSRTTCSTSEEKKVRRVWRLLDNSCCLTGNTVTQSHLSCRHTQYAVRSANKLNQYYFTSCHMWYVEYSNRNQTKMEGLWKCLSVGLSFDYLDNRSLGGCIAEDPRECSVKLSYELFMKQILEYNTNTCYIECIWVWTVGWTKNVWCIFTIFKRISQKDDQHINRWLWRYSRFFLLSINPTKIPKPTMC